MRVRHLPATVGNNDNDNNIKERFRFHQDVEKALNGGISFGSPTSNTLQTGQNTDGVWIIVADTGLANTEFVVTHNLNRIPVGLDVKRINAAAHVFDSGTAPSKTQMFFKCDVAHVAVTLYIH